MRRKGITASAAASVLSLAVLIVATRATTPASPQIVGRALASPFFDAREFARATAEVARTGAHPIDARVLVIPHHLLPATLIADALRDVATSGRIRRIILLGPNHIGTGHADIATSDMPWQTPYGLISADVGAVRSLVDARLVERESAVLTYEHSISGVIPAIAYYFPRAQIVPLALRGHLSLTRVESLGKAIARLSGHDTLVIAAVDFAHHISAEIAPARNRTTASTMRSLDVPTMLSYGNEHLDSPPSIATAMIVARLSGATTFRVLADSDSSAFGGPRADATSYIVAAWT